MNEYYVEMCFAFGITAKVRAESKEEAAQKVREDAPNLIDINETTNINDEIYIEDCGSLEYESTSFVEEVK